jgi:hypothetical protein
MYQELSKIEDTHGKRGKRYSLAPFPLLSYLTALAWHQLNRVPTILHVYMDNWCANFGIPSNMLESMEASLTSNVCSM